MRRCLPCLNKGPSDHPSSYVRRKGGAGIADKRERRRQADACSRAPLQRPGYARRSPILVSKIKSGVPVRISSPFYDSSASTAIESPLAGLALLVDTLRRLRGAPRDEKGSGGVSAERRRSEDTASRTGLVGYEYGMSGRKRAGLSPAAVPGGRGSEARMGSVSR